MSDLPEGTPLAESVRQASRDLIAGAIGDDPNENEPAAVAGTPFGDYVLEKELGRGAFGIVFLARHAGIHHHVALKRLRDGELATDSEIDRFLQGAAAAAMLEHPNIVPVFHVGGRGEIPFFTMRYVKGTNLAQALELRKPTLEQAVGWMVRIARAVQHAHDHGVIHLDLKPANILLDEAAVPYVTDFGLARRIGVAGTASHSSSAGGAPYYMAPEQLSGGPNALTVRSDLYALGVILYELVTGAVPYGDLEFEEWKTALLSPHPVPNPCELEPRLDPDLAAICARALAKHSEARYPSAHAFAEDLECLQREERDFLSFRAALPQARFRSWVRRRRLALGTLLWAICLATVFGFRLRTAYRSEHEAVARQEQQNASMASVQAVAFRFQLLEYAHRVARIAQQPELIALLASPTVENPSQLLRERAGGFDALYVMAADGRQRARTTRMPDEYMQRSFAFRDYFRGARQLALRECEPDARGAPAERTAYVARTHVSESDGQFEFTIAAPICDAHGWLGIIGASLSSNKVFGEVRLSDADPGRITALLGPRDAERKTVGLPLPAGLTFVVHPGLTPGREYQLRQPDPERIRAVLGIQVPSDNLRYVEPLQARDYADPVTGFSGPWSAAFAPVGTSGFVVLVQSPRAHGRSFFLHCADIAFELAAPFGAGLALLLAFRVRQRIATT